MQQDKLIFRLVNQDVRQRAIEAIKQAPDGYLVRITEPTRSLLQNSALWAALGEVSKQVVWHGRKLTAENWKDILTASLKKQEVVPGIDSGFVILGNSTSKMTKREMSELLELIYAFGAQQGVKFSA